MRKPLIVGNWKMHKTGSEASTFVRELVKNLPTYTSIDLVIAPPFTALDSVRTALGGSTALQLGAQNLFWAEAGAYTGEISAPMLRDLGCRYVILGHSERRHIFGEQDDGIQKKVLAALKHGLQPIVCVGETLAQRESGKTDELLSRQLSGSLGALTSLDMAAVSIAYEPVWAIGTGKAATPAQAVSAHRTIRGFLATTWSPAIGDATRILYGGSVTSENIESFLKADQVDGALIGGACLQVDSFAKIAAIAESIGVNC